MTAEEIIQQLSAFLPRFTDLFTQQASIQNLVLAGETVTLTTSTPHGLTTGDYGAVVNALVSVPILSISRSGKLATATTASPHDLTAGFQPTVNVSGASPEGFSGEHQLIATPNRYTFTYAVSSMLPAQATGTIILSETPFGGFNGWHSMTVVNANTLTYQVNAAIPMLSGGAPVLRIMPRISGAVDINRVTESYTKQMNNALWAFVVLGDTLISKDRNIDSDAVATMSPGDRFRQRQIQPFDVYIFVPAVNDLSGRASRDLMQTIAPYLYGSLLGYRPANELVEPQWSQIVATGHGFDSYVGSYYVHRFSFETTSDITYGDTIGPQVTHAFNNMHIDFLNQNPFNDSIIRTDDIVLNETT